MRYNKISIFIIFLLYLVIHPSIDVIAAEQYESELTGQMIDISIKNQRPIAVMVDNEKKALPHYGVSEADIVYEMMNSTANGRITRLMCLYKDWKSVPRIGSVRSVRTTHIPIAAEYNAILIHEGGPEIYITAPLSQPWSTDLNGGFSRLQNGKAVEFTEFVISGEVESHAKKAGVSLSYNEYKPLRDSHFVFGKTTVNLSSKSNVKSGIFVDLSGAFKHTCSKLHYNYGSNTYNYCVYGEVQADEDDNELLSFDNVIIQIAPFYELDENGYLTYQIFGQGEGYYLTRGKCIPIIWQKSKNNSITKYYYCDTNKEIEINSGKTYVAIYPEEYSSELVIK